MKLHELLQYPRVISGELAFRSCLLTCPQTYRVVNGIYVAHETYSGFMRPIHITACVECLTSDWDVIADSDLC